MVIADECHHASAFSYESILKTTKAKYIYGLTATPTRKDGQHPIFLCTAAQYGIAMMQKNRQRKDRLTIISFHGLHP
jgi:superfamily II DNA or RNA helicase